MAHENAYGGEGRTMPKISQKKAGLKERLNLSMAEWILGGVRAI